MRSKIDVGAIERELLSRGELWPPALVARVGGISRERLYDLDQRAQVPMEHVQGFPFVNVRVLLLHYAS